MCDLVTGLMAGSFLLQAGSTVAGHKAQSKASKANAAAAKDAFRQSFADANARGVEETIAAAAEEFQVARQANRASAAARVAAGEAGVMGTSVDLQLGQIERDRAESSVGRRANLARIFAQLERVKRGQMSLMESRIASVPQPNPWLAGLQIGASAIDLLTQLRRPTPPSSGN